MNNKTTGGGSHFAALLIQCSPLTTVQNPSYFPVSLWIVQNLNASGFREQSQTAMFATWYRSQVLITLKPD